MSPTRSQHERDATTVEIAFALMTGGLAAVAAFLLCVLPLLMGVVDGAWSRGLLVLGGTAAAVVFVWRVVLVLTRHARRLREGR
ncbi:DUF6332 family protein [Streptomyces sp. NPDC003077]|uniref:DUF6332 family protein n=1 Tax=Streptomyces sp. NPDC003077 TaxID=3154443 RepID=UPI0033A5F7EE